ncbi:hypothetical protein [Spiroplasma culicicola]|uniref:Transmembrane protein n=1 Tax=Spiroplasma culicicola AES-1 TaxID=1276246 RepID=W6A6M9_9MOLU|nr:hypothetical protein [Spiroplasma culicicola]AHI52652.1 transmembrane protein [Spiroplasma culicicola AES-1]
MSSLSLIIYLAVVLSFMTIIFLKTYNTILYSKIEVKHINSADINISTSKINEIMNSFLKFLNVNDLKINYGEHEQYLRVHQMLNKSNKTIDIPRWVMPSVGYELDYLLASIWYNCKIYNKDKEVKKYNFLVNILPAVFIFIYFILFAVWVVFIITISFFLREEDIIRSFLSVFQTYYLLEIPTIICFIVYISMIFLSPKLKYYLETKYEREIIDFVNSEFSGYKADIAAARVYALEIGKVHFGFFKLSGKTINIKFLGPFTNL